MILKCNDLLLKSISENEKGFDLDIQDYSILKYMSETRVHPGEISRSIRFNIIYQDEVIGEISINNIRWYNRKGTMTIILGGKYHGMGFGKRASLEIMKYAFDAMNFHRLEAEAVEYNPKSQALLEELGFVKEGICREAKYFEGKYHSVIKYGILSGEFRKKCQTKR